MRIMTTNTDREVPLPALVLQTLGRVAAVVIACVLVFPAVTSMAEEEEEKKPAALGTAKKAKKSKGLAGFAANVKLKKGESKTISNSNLSGSTGGGTLSQGGGVTTGVKPKAEDGKIVNPDGIPGKPTKKEKWNNEYEDQKKKIADLEKRAKTFDEKAEEHSDPYNDSPYNRAPGQASWADQQRDEQQKALEAEKQKLEKMRRKARREGVDLPRK